MTNFLYFKFTHTRKTEIKIETAKNLRTFSCTKKNIKNGGGGELKGTLKFPPLIPSNDTECLLLPDPPHLHNTFRLQGDL